MNVIAVIPARGGSKGIPRKNVRLLGGKPLISYSIQNAQKSKYHPDVIVSTDDEEIARIARQYGASVLIRPDELANDDVTLDPVVYQAVNTYEQQSHKRYDTVITMQPTSPLLATGTLDAAMNYFMEHDFDTVISGINQPHLAWTERNGEIVPSYEKRLNRQYLPKHILETGAFFISKRQFLEENNRFGPRVSVFEVPLDESIDIDSPQDWWIAEKEISRKRILIRVEGYAKIGLGHIYRGLILANHMIDHHIRFVLSSRSDLGIEKVRSSHFPYTVIEDDMEIYDLLRSRRYDILINDMLDTQKGYIENCKATGARVVNFEDLGPGAAEADAVINDLYDKKNELKNHYWGSKYYCIKDEFLIAQPTVFREEVREVLILFGGTDPCNLTRRVLDVIKSIGRSDLHYTCILGMGYAGADELNGADNIDFVKDVKLMSEYMGSADIAVSSQGRTMLELASMSVPTILLAQNERELHHEFGYLKNGFINLGLGTEVEDKTIRETLIWLMNSPQIRRQMKEQMRKADLRQGIERVKNIIMGHSL